MIKRSQLALLFAILGASALVISSGAALPLGEAPTDEMGEGVELKATSDYATMNDEGDLRIDISQSNENLGDAQGLNPDAKVVIQDVAALKYNGTEAYADIHVEPTEDGLEVRAAGHSIESPENSVNLTEGETANLTLILNTKYKAELDGEVTLTFNASGNGPEESEVSALSFGTDDVEPPTEEPPETTTETPPETTTETPPETTTETPPETPTETPPEPTTETPPEATTAAPPVTTTESPPDTAAQNGLLEEPMGIPLERLLGLGLAGLMGVALITLFRRVSV